MADPSTRPTGSLRAGPNDQPSGYRKSTVREYFESICIAVILAFLLIGIPILIALGIAYVVFVVIAAVRANAGEHYRYPVTIRFVR